MELKIEEVAIPEKISFNYEELKTEIQEKAHEYAMSVYTEDSIKDAKSDRAKLNKLKKALNDERIKREREYLEPLNKFKTQINEIIGIIDEPINAIDTQIKGYEQKKKDEKYDSILELWNEKNHPEWLSFEQAFNPKWLNATVSMKKVEDDINLGLQKVENDLATLAELPEFGFEATEVYKTTLNISKAIEEGKRLAEIQKRKEEQERLSKEQAELAEKRSAMVQKLEESAKEQAEKEQAQELEVTEPVTPTDNNNTEPMEKGWVSFSALLSREDAKALANFFKSNNIEYKPIV